jgi:hypothetical protein
MLCILIVLCRKKSFFCEGTQNKGLCELTDMQEKKNKGLYTVTGEH